MEKNKLKVLIYCRVSTKKQNVDQQAAFCKKWAKEQGYEVVWTLKDKQSGRDPLIKRDKFVKIIKNEYNYHYDAVLVQSLDRLTRNWEDQPLIENFFRDNDKVELLSCSDNIDLKSANGRFIFRIIMANNCRMPEEMRERQKVGIERARKEGKFKGRPKSKKIAFIGKIPGKRVLPKLRMPTTSRRILR